MRFRWWEIPFVLVIAVSCIVKDGFVNLWEWYRYGPCIKCDHPRSWHLYEDGSCACGKCLKFFGIVAE